MIDEQIGHFPYIQPHEVEDEFSKTMVSSIPKKVAEWLARLEQDLTKKFTYLSKNKSSFIFTVSPEGGILEYDNCEDDYHVALWWSGRVYEIEGISVSDSVITDVKNNLDYFVNVEKRIYNILEEFENYQEDFFPKMPLTYERV